MKNQVDSLLEDDHESLGQLLTELDSELTKASVVRSFDLLDLFWARLAVHIRAENVHLFPALANADSSLFGGKGGLPTAEEAEEILSRLRSDHDFFMKELAQMIKTARGIGVGEEAGRDETDELRKRLAVIRKRLETHNRMEEEQVYKWPSMLFDQETVTSLKNRLRHELESLPPRFV